MKCWFIYFLLFIVVAVEGKFIIDGETPGAIKSRLNAGCVESVTFEFDGPCGALGDVDVVTFAGCFPEFHELACSILFSSSGKCIVSVGDTRLSDLLSAFGVVYFHLPTDLGQEFAFDGCTTTDCPGEEPLCCQPLAFALEATERLCLNSEGIAGNEQPDCVLSGCEHKMSKGNWIRIGQGEHDDLCDCLCDARFAGFFLDEEFCSPGGIVESFPELECLDFCPCSGSECPLLSRCDKDFCFGDRVECVNPAGCEGLVPTGMRGTLVSTTDGPSPQILVDWDGPLPGHNGNGFSRCPAGIDPSPCPHPGSCWYINCEDIEKVGVLADRDLEMPARFGSSPMRRKEKRTEDDTNHSVFSPSS